MTEDSYWWLKDNANGRGCRVWGTKGSSRPLTGMLQVGEPLYRTPSGKPLPDGLRIIGIDTNKFKSLLHARFKNAIEQQPRGSFLHRATEKTYFDHIATEGLQDIKGVETWVKTGSGRNDLLDASVLALACVHREWPGGGVEELKASKIVNLNAANSSPNRREQPVRYNQPQTRRW